MKVLFLLAHSNLAASARFRVHQYIPFLEQHGIHCDVRPFFSADLFGLMYRGGNISRKVGLFSGQTLSRLRDLGDARDYDVLFVQRECFPVGPAWMERYLARLGRPIVFDFDDAIFLPRPSPLVNWVRRPSKTSAIVSLADQVIVSTEHLRGYAAAYNTNVWVIPTSVDTQSEYRARQYLSEGPSTPPGPVRIGWIGGHSTARYFDRLAPVLERIGRRYPIEVLVVGAGREFSIPGVRVENRKWTLDNEADSFRSLDIGVYPLPDGVWERGKGGFKAIQYMAAAVPSVVSPVGVLKDMVSDGEHAYFATDDASWEDRLARLIADPALRRRMGESGRRHCEAEFSVHASAPKLLHVLEVAAANRPQRKSTPGPIASLPSEPT